MTFNDGLRAIAYEKRRACDDTSPLIALLEAVRAVAETGLRAHDRWMLAHGNLTRKLTRRRSTSQLPALIELVMSRRLVSTGMVAQALGITQRGAQNLVGELGLKELTGRADFAPGPSFDSYQISPEGRRGQLGRSLETSSVRRPSKPTIPALLLPPQPCAQIFSCAGFLRVQIQTAATLTTDSAPLADEGRIAEQRRLDRQNVEMLHVPLGLDPLEHEKLDDGHWFDRHDPTIMSLSHRGVQLEL